MHIIEQVSDIKFPTNAPHTMLKISNKMSHKARKEMEDAAAATHALGSCARALGSQSHASPMATSRPHHAASEEAPSSSSGKQPPNKFKFFMNYMFGACYASA
jgi:hypothetical protein